MKLFLIVKTVLLSTVFVWGTGCVCIHNEYPLRIKVGTDDMGHTYSIVDSETDSLIYDGGHNEITLDTVINEVYIFREDLWTEECSSRLIVYDLGQSLLLRAGVVNGLDFDDSKNPKIESLDFEDRIITTRFSNGKVCSFELQGEKYGDYWIDYFVRPSSTVADVVVLSSGDTVKVMNNYLQIVVSYKGEWILDRTLQSTSFDGVINPDQCILAPTGKVWFEIEDDRLVASTGMYENETDCGYLTEMVIDPEGNMSLHYVSSESLLGFDDLLYDLREEISQEELADYTIHMDFYNEPSSSPEEYAHLFVFCLDNKDAGASETVRCKFTEMLDLYPDKVREMKQYLNSFSSDFKKEIKESLIRCVDIE